MYKPLKLVDAQELLLIPLNDPGFIVEDLIPGGVNVLAGDEKSGKSWMMLQLAISIATGQDFLDHHVDQGKVLYLSLEDTYARIQKRMFKLTDEIGEGRVLLGIQSGTLDADLLDQLNDAVEKVPGIKLIIIDTLQLIRSNGKDMSYANDYSDVAKLKDFAREHGLSVFLVHHLRKQGDAHNIFNRLNGTKGINGAVDTMVILDKENEYSNRATLYVKGRDIQPVEMQIEFNDCKWELVSIRTQEEIAAANTPEVIHNLVDFIKERRAWRGSATELLNELGDQSVGTNVITKYVNQYKGSLLLDEGIVYDYSRTHADGRILSFTPFTAEELLSSIIDDGILDEDGVHKLMSKKKLDYVQKNHSLSIWKGADGRWRTYLPDAEKPNGRKLVSRGSHDELISMLFDFYTEAEKQRKRLQITLEELFDEWQQHKSIYVTDSTIKRDKTTWKSLYEGDAITKKPICSLTKADIEEWILKKVRSKEMNAHQYNNFSLVMRQMLEYAMEIEIISSNPFDRIKIPKSRVLKPEVKKPSEQEVFFPDERDALIQYAFKQFEEKRDRVQIFIPLAIAFLLYVGLRRGEVTALRFDDINGKQIILHDSYSHDMKCLKGRLKDGEGSSA